MFSHIRNAIRSRWGRYSVVDLSADTEQIVSCLSLTDLSESNIAKSMSYNPMDGPETKRSLTHGKKRPLSSVSQLSGWSNGASSGYSSYSESQESLTNLARNDSIQRRLHSISRRRRQLNNANRKRLRDSMMSTDSLLEENDSSDDIIETRSFSKTRPLSVNLEDLRAIPSDEIQTQETTSRVHEFDDEERLFQHTRPKSVHFDTDDGHDADSEADETDRNVTSVLRQKSIQLKAWEIRRHRRALAHMRKRSSRLLEHES